jgi:hypothetical protein
MHARDTREQHTGFLVARCEGIRLLTRWRHESQENTEMDLKETGWMWRRFIWLRTGTSGGLL